MTVQFGTGPSFAAQCPKLVVPSGYRPWNAAIDGPVPTALSARAQALAADQGVPLGATESYPLPGVTPLLVVEANPWSQDANGSWVEGCQRATNVFLPSEVVTPPTATSGNMPAVVTVLTVASLGVGLALSVPELFR